MHTQPGDHGHGTVPGQVGAHWVRRGGTERLIGRRGECGTLDRLVEAVRAGESRALVVRGGGCCSWRRPIRPVTGH